MSVMAKKKPKPRRKPKRKGSSFTLWLPEHLSNALDWCHDNMPYEPSKRAIIVKALEEHLPKIGVDLAAVADYISLEKRRKRSESEEDE